MIEFTKSYKTADGQVFATIGEAQTHDLSTELAKVIPNPLEIPQVAQFLLDQKDVIVDILTTTPNSKPKARAIHGGTKKRNKTVITDAATNAATTVNT
jgi:hypothetical protein